MVSMNGIISIDKAGRLVLPKAVRQHFRLLSGSRLGIRVLDEHIELYPIDGEPALVKEGDWWVHRGAVEDNNQITDSINLHREDSIRRLSR